MYTPCPARTQRKGRLTRGETEREREREREDTQREAHTRETHTEKKKNSKVDVFLPVRTSSFSGACPAWICGGVVREHIALHVRQGYGRTSCTQMVCVDYLRG